MKLILTFVSLLLINFCMAQEKTSTSKAEKLIVVPNGTAENNSADTSQSVRKNKLIIQNNPEQNTGKEPEKKKEENNTAVREEQLKKVKFPE